MRAAAAMLIAIGVAVPTSTANAVGAAPCRHQLTDPVGDLNTTTPTVIVAGQAADLIAADVRTDARNLYAKVQVVDLPDEASAPVADLAYRVTITTNGQSYWLDYDNMKLGGPVTEAWHVTAGDASPEDNPNGGAGSGELAGDGTGKVDVRKNTVLMTFPRSAFAASGGVGRTITGLHAISWWGNGVREPTTGSFEGSYAGADLARSAAVYTSGRPSCA
ncbi:MAG: hypothetical protein QOE99_1525 [Actinomycetota bacterium]|nr:hypothetical protein [Actinomycetota bacterium]